MKLRCIVCKHTETREAPTEQPMCPKCYGMMICEKVSSR